MKVKIILQDPNPEGSILICGLPGIAYVGKLSVDYLIRELGAKLVGEVYSQFFPPFVLIDNDGVSQLLRNELHYYEDEAKRGIFFLTGNAQAASPEGQYQVADYILDWTIKFGVKKVFSIAAFLTNKPFEQPKVYGTATTPVLIEEIKKHQVLPMSEGSISGMNGLILGLARIKELEGVALLGETRGYQTPSGLYLADAKAAKVVLKVLTKILDLKVNMDPLDEQTKQMDEFITRIAEVERRAKEERREASDRTVTRYIT
jgi:uncharacterized protein (TIGR00162 family)